MVIGYIAAGLFFTIGAALILYALRRVNAQGSKDFVALFLGVANISAGSLLFGLMLPSI